MTGLQDLRDATALFENGIKERRADIPVRLRMLSGGFSYWKLGGKLVLSYFAGKSESRDGKSPGVVTSLAIFHASSGRPNSTRALARCKRTASF